LALTGGQSAFPLNWYKSLSANPPLTINDSSPH
jgi:hypothetical protein